MFVKSSKTEIRECEYGLGVFAVEAIEAGELVEVAPCVVVPYSEPCNQFMKSYCFADDAGVIVPMGYAGLYNHSPDPNVNHQVFASERAIVFQACRDIEPNDQLFINYGESYPL